MIEFIPYLLLGTLAGLLAGLLGVGGGLLIVPVLAGIFSSKGMPTDIIMHLALGTSLSSILATSLSSVYSHHKKQAVSWPHCIKLSPGILIGAWCGGLLAGNLSSNFLKPVFAGFELAVAAYMLWGSKAQTHSQLPPSSPSQLPSLNNFTLSGGVIGFISSIVGIGGGTITIPWLMWHGSNIHKAIATSAATGLPIAIAGSLSYLYTGWNHPQLPEAAVGFIYLPALAGIIASSIFFAPLGASLAHRLPVNQLKRIFAGLLILLAVYLLSS